MNQSLLNFSKKLWPELETLPQPKQLVGVGDVFSSIYSTLLYIIGITWLVTETDFRLLQDEFPVFLFFFVIIAVLSRLTYFMIIEFRYDRYGVSDGSFDSMMVWTIVFIFGATGLWTIIIDRLFAYIYNKRNKLSKASTWDEYRNLSLTLAGFTLPYLFGLQIYEKINGSFQIQSTPYLIAGFAAIILNFILHILIWLPYFYYSLTIQKILAGDTDTQPVSKFFLQALTIPTLAHPFALLGASIYIQNELPIFVFYVLGIISIAYFARQFSRIAEKNRQQSKQLEKLEKLGRAILNAPPEMTVLPDILAEHIPNMFPSGNIAIWTIPGQTIYKAPNDWEKEFGDMWDWVDEQNTVQSFLAEEALPWNKDEKHQRPIICAPIMAYEGQEVIGGIYLELRQLSQSWDKSSLEILYPGILTLSDQISSAIHQAEEYAQLIAYQKVDQEIQIAGQIQASFLPNQFPNIPGWQLAVTLIPAGGLSGDFFDFIPLSRGRSGILIADVADKGLGAALYMALCRTLLRTYALEYHSRPDVVFGETNDRILNDARANLFITCFYGILDPEKNSLIYCNAGHNPPLLISSNSDGEYKTLDRTGMPIGIEEETRWGRNIIEFSQGDKLILYTDGITESRNANGEFFNIDLLAKAACANPNGSAYEIQSNILQQVKEFTGDSPQEDDITLMILSNESI